MGSARNHLNPHKCNQALPWIPCHTVSSVGPRQTPFGAPVVQTSKPIGPEGPGGWLTVREAALGLKVSRQTIYNLVDSGELAYIRVGNMIRIAESACS